MLQRPLLAQDVNATSPSGGSDVSSSSSSSTSTSISLSFRDRLIALKRRTIEFLYKATDDGAPRRFEALVYVTMMVALILVTTYNAGHGGDDVGSWNLDEIPRSVTSGDYSGAVGDAEIL